MKKRILIFIDWYYPGYKAGGPIRSCLNLVSHLSDEFDFFIVTGDKDYMDFVQYPEVRMNQWNKLEGNSKVYYSTSEMRTKNNFNKIIQDINPDFVFLNGIFSPDFTILPLRTISKSKTKTFVAVRGMLAPNAMKIKFFKKKLFLFVAKLFGLFNNVIFVASNDGEKDQIKKIFIKSEIKIAPNLSRKVVKSRVRPVKNKGELKLLNIARIAPEKNLLFALEILQTSKNNIVFDLYGTIYDKDYWKNCQSVIKSFPSNIKTQYKGEIPTDKIFELMSEYHFLFLPSLGENFGHIILESMSVGLPVIVSDRTPWRNLPLKNAGWDISLKDKIAFSTIIEKCSNMNNDEYFKYSQGAAATAFDFINDKEKIKANRELFS